MGGLRAFEAGETPSILLWTLSSCLPDRRSVVSVSGLVNLRVSAY
jgi:hypothetical protein